MPHSSQSNQVSWSATILLPTRSQIDFLLRVLCAKQRLEVSGTELPPVGSTFPVSFVCFGQESLRDEAVLGAETRENAYSLEFNDSVRLIGALSRAHQRDEAVKTQPAAATEQIVCYFARTEVQLNQAVLRSRVPAAEPSRAARSLTPVRPVDPRNQSQPGFTGGDLDMSGLPVEEMFREVYSQPSAAETAKAREAEPVQAAKRGNVPSIQRAADDTGEFQIVLEDDRPQAATAEAEAFGIDFGNTYCWLGRMVGANVELIGDEQGVPAFPTVVSYPAPNRPVVGWKAKQMLLTYPQSTFLGPKRLIGRSFDDPFLKAYLNTTGLRAERGQKGEVVCNVGGQSLSAVDVCRDIFAHLRTLTKHGTGRDLTRAVMAAPVSFNGTQRSALRMAANMAGIEVLTMVDEPVAAALAYGTRARPGQLIAIYDFGGGTFDFTVLEVKSDSLRVYCKDGEPWLGGDDLDLALADYVVDQFQKEYSVNLRHRAVEWERIKFLCERAKRQLSVDNSAAVHLPRVLRTPRGLIDLNVMLSRQLLNKLAAPLVQRSLELITECLSRAGLAVDDVQQIVLTGGMARMPTVRFAVEQFFGRPIDCMRSPEQAVVMGASFVAASYGHQ